jgi:hypothetical protein
VDSISPFGSKEKQMTHENDKANHASIILGLDIATEALTADISPASLKNSWPRKSSTRSVAYK